MTQGFRLLTAACLAFPLAGCYGVIVPKPIPEWAVVSQPEVVAARPAPRRVARIPSDQTLSSVTVAARSERVRTAEPVTTTTRTYGPEWQAQQDAADEQLKRRMNICRGC